MMLPKPWWLRLFVQPYQWVTIFPDIYHPEDRNPSDYPAIISHEEVHLRQQSTCNRWAWYWRYLTDGSFRLAMEAEGIAAEVIASPAGTREALIGDYANALAGDGYRHAATSYQEAYQAIKKAVSAITI